ncbi:unnamed protein product [Amoebophrya sp. A120]|nr:unnamed protein product [Amoebophrya sp. A120]|eukprot:GSA120T00017758001.1
MSADALLGWLQTPEGPGDDILEFLTNYDLHQLGQVCREAHAAVRRDGKLRCRNVVINFSCKKTGAIGGTREDPDDLTLSAQPRDDLTTLLRHDLADVKTLRIEVHAKIPKCGAPHIVIDPILPQIASLLTATTHLQHFVLIVLDVAPEGSRYADPDHWFLYQNPVAPAHLDSLLKFQTALSDLKSLEVLSIPSAVAVSSLTFRPGPGLSTQLPKLSQLHVTGFLSAKKVTRASFLTAIVLGRGVGARAPSLTTVSLEGFDCVAGSGDHFPALWQQVAGSSLRRLSVRVNQSADLQEDFCQRLRQADWFWSCCSGVTHLELDFPPNAPDLSKRFPSLQALHLTGFRRETPLKKCYRPKVVELLKTFDFTKRRLVLHDTELFAAELGAMSIILSPSVDTASDHETLLHREQLRKKLEEIMNDAKLFNSKTTWCKIATGLPLCWLTERDISAGRKKSK